VCVLHIIALELHHAPRLATPCASEHTRACNVTPEQLGETYNLLITIYCPRDPPTTALKQTSLYYKARPKIARRPPARAGVPYVEKDAAAALLGSAAPEPVGEDAEPAPEPVAEGPPELVAEAELEELELESEPDASIVSLPHFVSRVWMQLN
jgi:hypothetical protein